MKLKSLVAAAIALAMSFNVLAQDLKTQAAEVLSLILQAQSTGTTLDSFPQDQQAKTRAFLEILNQQVGAKIEADAQTAGYNSDDALTHYLADGAAFKQLVADMKAQEAALLKASKVEQFIALVTLEMNLDIQEKYYFPYVENADADLEAAADYLSGLYSTLANAVGFKTTK